MTLFEVPSFTYVKQENRYSVTKTTKTKIIVKITTVFLLEKLSKSYAFVPTTS
jgi:hypothetical protein